MQAAIADDAIGLGMENNRPAKRSENLSMASKCSDTMTTSVVGAELSEASAISHPAGSQASEGR